MVNFRHYKLLVFDIDGTLIGSNRKLHPYTKAMLNRVRENGKQFTLATGLNLAAAKAIADELEINLPLILSNGGIIQVRNGEVIDKTVLPLDITLEVIQICEDEKKDLVIYVDSSLYTKKMNANIWPTYNRVASHLYEIGKWADVQDKLKDANKCVVVDQKSEEGLKKIERIFQKKVGQRAEICRTSPPLLEVLPKGVSKATGIQKLAKVLGLGMDEIMAFGDYDNDAAMLAAAGLGVAVANATSAAKESADLIIGSCEENGIARFLKEMLA